MLFAVLLIGAAVILVKSGLAWVAILVGIGIFLGLRMGRQWGFNQLGTYENRERMRRARLGGWGIF